MTATPTTPRFPHLLRLPSFGLALAASLAVLATFAVWMFVDALFPVTLQVVRIDAGLLDPHPQWMDTSLLHGWDLLGPRLVVFASLAAAGAVAALLVFYRLLVGNPRGRSLRAIFTTVALMALWLTLALSRQKLESTGYYWRIHRAVQGLKQDAAILLTDWPTGDGTLPFTGDFDATFQDRLLWVRLPFPYDYPMREIIGPFVTRADDGGLRFDYDNGLLSDQSPEKIEYHPSGSKPTSFREVIQDNGKVIYDAPWALRTFIELEPNWYYVTYLPDE